MIDIARALADQQLLGAALGPIDTWSTWVAVLKAAFGLDLTAEELAVFSSVAGNRAPPRRRVRELWCVIGRRSGKSRIAAALAVFIALFTKHRLAKGERGMILVLASSVEQSRVVFGYVRAFLTESPILAGEIAETTANEIRLKNGVVIAIHANSFKTILARDSLRRGFLLARRDLRATGYGDLHLGPSRARDHQRYAHRHQHALPQAWLALPEASQLALARTTPTFSSFKVPPGPST